jgi:hypothetical protein
MPIVENSSLRLVLKSDVTTLTLDKRAGNMTLQRKFLLWQRKVVRMALSAVSDVTIDIAVDRTSGIEVCHTTVIARTGQAWALQAADKKEAQANATAMREFLGLAV